MKNNVLFLLTLVFITSVSVSVNAQRGVRIGYIDTEFILENIPEYQEATSQLNDKANKWKNEIDEKLSTIEQKRKDLSNEKALLTKELIDEREEDIAFEENEILDYQQKRFGPNGDLFIQKKQLMQPIQDQIFAAVQDLATTKQYDIILDKSETVMLFSAKQFDLSDQIIRSITRSAKRTQAETKAELKAAKDEELVPEINYELEARQKALEEKKEERVSAIEKARQDKLDARAAKVKEAEDRRQKIIDDREKAKANTTETKTTEPEIKVEQTSKSVEVKAEEKVEVAVKAEAKTDAKVDEVKTETKTQAQLIEENRLKKLAERDARKKELEDRKKKILEERQKTKDSINNK